MNLTEQLQEAKNKAKELENKIANCKHEFSKHPAYDPDTKQEPYGSVQDGKGSDPHWSPEGYKTVEVPRWSRSCIFCGHKQYTFKQKSVVTKTEPDFES